MNTSVREYDAKLDSKKRITLRGCIFEYYHVKEKEDGTICLSLVNLESLSEFPRIHYI